MKIYWVESVCKYAINKKNDVYKKNNVIFDNEVNLLVNYNMHLRLIWPSGHP